MVAAVTTANGNEPVGAFINANNFHGRLFEPLGNVITVGERSRGWKRAVALREEGSTAGQTAKGGIDWFEAGRLHTGDILWTEDCKSTVSYFVPSAVR